MSFESWNAFLQEQLGREQTPPPVIQSDESEVEQIGQKDKTRTAPIQ